jgi:hypothetical protein
LSFVEYDIKPEDDDLLKMKILASRNLDPEAFVHTPEGKIYLSDALASQIFYDFKLNALDIINRLKDKHDEIKFSTILGDIMINYTDFLMNNCGSVEDHITGDDIYDFKQIIIFKVGDRTTCL